MLKHRLVFEIANAMHATSIAKEAASRVYLGTTACGRTSGVVTALVRQELRALCCHIAVTRNITRPTRPTQVKEANAENRFRGLVGITAR
jgi:hypothetical protein